MSAVMQSSGWPAVYQPAPWVVMDTETDDAPADAVDAAIEGWKAPSNWRPETAEAKRAEASAKIRGKAALLNASPFAVICAATPFGAVTFTPFGVVEVAGNLVIPADDERGMLIQFRAWLDVVATPGETELVMHNGIGFDAPKIRQAYLRHRLRIPAAFADQSTPIYDTMHRIKSFSMEHRDDRFISLESVCRVLDIPRPKTVIDGSEVPRLMRGRQFQAIATYCAVDVAATTRAYLLMTGQAQDLE